MVYHNSTSEISGKMKPSKNLMYINTDDDQDNESEEKLQTSHQDSYHYRDPIYTSAPHNAWQSPSAKKKDRLRSSTKSHHSSTDQRIRGTSVQDENESIYEINSVALMLFGNGHKRHSTSYTPSWQDTSHSTTLPSLNTNSHKKPAQQISLTSPSSDTLGTQTEKTDPLQFTQQKVRYHGRRRNSLMVPLPQTTNPLIPPSSRQRSNSLSPVHHLPRLSHLVATEAYPVKAQPGVELMNRRRRTSSNSEGLLNVASPEKTRTPSSLDLV